MHRSPLVEVRHKQPPLKALTSLRLLAAAYVVVYHLNLQKDLGSHPLLANLLGSGYTGVTLFFVLSGFILAYNYPEIRSLKDFWVARFARIYPAYFLAAMFAILRPADWHFPHTIPKTITGLLLVQGWWPAYADALNQYGWTVSVEAFFYVIFPFLLPVVQRMRLRTFVLIQVAYLLLLIMPILLSHANHRDAGLYLEQVLESRMPAVRINAFFVGVFSSTFWLRRSHARVSSNHSSLNTSWLPWIAFIVAAPLLCATWDTSALALRTGLLIYAYALLIYGLSGGVWPVLSSHWMQVGGEISYGIYILQSPVALTYAALSRHILHNAEPSQILFVAALVGVAYASFRWYETPARLMIRRALGSGAVPTRPI